MAIGSFKLPNTAATSTAVTDEWIRPTDWLAMPTIGTQEFIGLLAVTDDESNHIALTCQGAYTVDWGDGVTENVATNVKAQHTYTYSSISGGTLTTRGYKQVLVRVTPQAGQNLTKVDLQQQNSILAKVHTVSWLDIAIKGSNITTLTLGGSTVYIFMCENVDIYSFGAITNLSLLFYQMYALQKFTLPSTASVNNFSAILANCISIKKIPLINTISGTNFSDMVSGCYSLKEVPLFNTVAGTNFSNMFQNCYSLQSIPLFNTEAGTNFSQMLRACYSLQQAPNLNTALGTSFSNMMLSSTSIAKGAFQGTRYAISYASMCLSRNAVVDIFNGLGTAVGAQTITITTNPAFSAIPLNTIGGNWRGIAIQSSSQDVYASNSSTQQIYKQTGGVGSFIAESASSSNYKGMGTDIYGNIYACNSGTTTGLVRKLSGSSSWITISTPGITVASYQVSGDYLGNLYVGTYGAGAGLLKQTAMTGSFVQVFSGYVGSLAISPIDGSIYVTDIGATGTIYKQTAGIGTFNAVQNIPYASVWCSVSGDVYACNGGILYKQTAGTGLFVSMGITNLGNYGGVEKLDGTLYTVNTDIYLTDFNKVVTPTDRLIATNKGWTIA